MSCIYIIKNSVNEKVYIGQTKNSLEKRFTQHKGQIHCKNKCSALYSAFEKYGVDKFWIELIESGDFSENELNEKEIFYIREYNSMSPNGYNLQFGGNCSGMSEETKEKISKSLKGRKILWSGEVSRTMKEKWKDPKYREMMSKAHSHPHGKYKKHNKPLRKNLPTEEMKKMYADGRNINQVAKAYGVSFYTAKRRIFNGN